jgi:microcystin-dependent protein
MSEPFLGQIALFGFNFAPTGWAFCAGQLLSISQNAALFSLFGTMYGGNGTSNFGLPDLQGRVPISAGQGPGLSDYVQGEEGGFVNVTLNQSTNARHNHTFNATTDAGTTTIGSGNQVAKGEAGSPHVGFTKANMYSTAAPNTNLANNATTFTGGNGPHNNVQPFQVLNYCVALRGIFPSRN